MKLNDDRAGRLILGLRQQGVTDPDYCVLKLTVHKGSHYHGLHNTAFLPEELE